jgi:hypothetical protein
MCYNLHFSELHAAAELSQDPAAFLARHGLRDVVGDCLRWIERADVQAVLEAAKSNPLHDDGLTPFHWFMGEMQDSLGLWSEQTDGIDMEPVREAVRRKLFVARGGGR